MTKNQSYADRAAAKRADPTLVFSHPTPPAAANVLPTSAAKAKTKKGRGSRG